MKFYLSLFFLFIVYFSFSKANCAEITLNNVDCVCDPRNQDKFEEPLQFNFGFFANQCIDSCRFRRIKILSQNNNAKKDSQGAYWEVANILHLKKYWTAHVPVERVEKVLIGFEEFSPRVYHVFLRFHFSEEVELISQNKIGKNTVTKVQDLVFSAEGVPPKNHPYQLFESALGRYLLAYRFQTIEETHRWMVQEKKHPVKQFQVNLSKERKIEVLKESLQKSMDLSFKSIYHLLTNNCATSALDLLEKPAPLQLNPLQSLVRFRRGLSVRAFYSTLAELESLGLIESSDQISVVKNLEEEFLKKN